MGNDSMYLDDYLSEYLSENDGRGFDKGLTVGTFLARRLCGRARDYSKRYGMWLEHALERARARGEVILGTSIRGGLAWYRAPQVKAELLTVYVELADSLAVGNCTGESEVWARRIASSLGASDILGAVRADVLLEICGDSFYVRRAIRRARQRYAHRAEQKERGIEYDYPSY